MRDPRPRQEGGPPRRDEVTRRAFLELSAAGAAAAGAGRFAAAGASRSVLAKESQNHGGIPYRTLGRTGEKVSLIGIGGAHLGGLHDDEEAVRIVRSALDSGVNFLDNSWDYSHGRSEERMGKALRDGYRQKAFLMTKIDGQTRQSALRQLDESLRRLETDHLDLLQFHEVIRMADPERIFGPGGSLEAALEARKAGKIRYLGFTGHKSPDIHLHMLETAAAHDFTFDTVQMPLNVMDAHFHSFAKRVLPVAAARGTAVLAMKPLGDHFVLDSRAATAVESLHYAMNLPVSVVITGCDSLAILQQAIDAARSFRPLTEAQLATLLAKTAQAAQDGRYEPYKTSHQFDSTMHNPEWLG